MFAGVHHIVNGGSVSRAGWARHVLAAMGVEVPIVEVPLATWTRPSAPPAWAVLTPTILPSGEHLRPWQAAFADYAPLLRRDPAASSPLPGVRWGRITRHLDERGSFRELWRAAAFGPLDAAATGLPGAAFIQANLSMSAAGVLRGLHFHRRQLDHWIVARGRALVALVDVRPMIEGRDPRPLVE